MDSQTASILLELNRQFYQTFAQPFSATRQRIQPGVRQVIERLPSTARLLDLGCGNGWLWRVLQHSGFTGRYVGLDFSAGLLDAAHQPEEVSAPDQPAPAARFIQGDLAAPGWEQSVKQALQEITPPANHSEPAFDNIFAFAVLHHIPSDALRLQILRQVRACLAPGGQFIHSEWQFRNSPRLLQRVQPWETVAPSLGLALEELDEGDTLLDWRQGGSGLRYVHHYSEPELHSLASAAGFQVIETFYSDGEGGRLGLYQVWETAPR